MKLSGTARQLFIPYRNKVLYGGRGGGKSHDVAGALLAQGVQKKMFIVCAREIQKSIKDSVHRLLKNKINEDNVLKSFYTVLQDKIVGINGTEFVFTGLKHNPEAVKSLEGADVCWVEEADNVSERSWEVLIPTIRKEGSEIWVTFNPRYVTDPTWVRFVQNADEDTFVKKVGWQDNPWFPETLNKERLKLKKLDLKAYNHVWEGMFDERFQGAVYASQVKQAIEDGRISRVPHKQGVPVFTVWDLGRSDRTSIWFVQKIGKEVRVIDFYENNNEDLPHYAEVIRSKNYEYSTHYMPHDSKHERLGMQGSIKAQFEAMGLKCSDIPMIGEMAGIALGRTLLGEVWIDSENCKDGLHALNHFQFEYNESTQSYKDKPRHDWASHASDAWRYLAVVLDKLTSMDTEEVELDIQVFTGGNSWAY